MTLRDVADEAGVHPATASRALNPEKQKLVNSETVERVTAAARRLGYVADPLAKMLRGGRSQQVGVLVRTLQYPWVGNLLHGIDDVLQASGYTTWITYTGDDPLRVRTLVEEMTQWRAGGLIIGTSVVPDEVIVRAVQADLPVVLVARDAPDQVCSAVNADNEGGARTAVGHLMRLGHTRIGCIAGPQDIHLFRARLRGFRAAMEEAGLRADPRLVRIADDYTIEAGQASCRELLNGTAQVTAIVTANDWYAIGCYGALREAGLRCPRDVSVMGFDDLPLIDRLTPALSSMRFPGYELGCESARLVMSLVRGEATSKRTVLLATELLARESTAAPAE